MQNDFVSDVRSKANGYWPSILERLAIPTNRGEGPCPACGGKTRYRFDNKDIRFEVAENCLFTAGQSHGGRILIV